MAIKDKTELATPPNVATAAPVSSVPALATAGAHVAAVVAAPVSRRTDGYVRVRAFKAMLWGAIVREPGAEFWCSEERAVLGIMRGECERI